MNRQCQDHHDNLICQDHRLCQCSPAPELADPATDDWIIEVVNQGTFTECDVHSDHGDECNCPCANTCHLYIVGYEHGQLIIRDGQGHIYQYPMSYTVNFC